jgi:hypothetical protein
MNESILMRSFFQEKEVFDDSQPRLKRNSMQFKNY